MTSTTTAGRAHPAGRRLSPRARTALLTAHLASGVGLAGVALVLASLGIAGLGGAPPATVYPAMSLAASAVLVPLAFLGLVSGVLQAVLTGYGLFRHGWVTTKLAVTGLLTAVAVLIAAPGLGRAADAATSAGQQVTAAQQVVSTVTPALALLLLLLNTTLGVVRPRRRRAG